MTLVAIRGFEVHIRAPSLNDVPWSKDTDDAKEETRISTPYKPPCRISVEEFNEDDEPIRTFPNKQMANATLRQANKIMQSSKVTTSQQ